MSRLRAEVIFTFEGPSLEAGGQRLRELQEAARRVGLEVRSAEVHPDDREEGNAEAWKPYAPA